MTAGRREYSHRRPDTYETPYLIATWSANEPSTAHFDRFHKQRRRAELDEQRELPDPQSPFMLKVAEHNAKVRALHRELGL